MQTRKYKALLSSDWNECLAPCGPFDAIIHHYPQYSAELEAIFRQYTGNAVSLAAAVRQIKTLLPQGLTPMQMDAYLERDFRTYAGVPELIRWCRDHDVLFMVNTTGMIGYFQRALANRLMPRLPVLAAHPMIRFEALPSDPGQILMLRETSDKAVHTDAIAAQYKIDPQKIFLMGDSGGDGPHFAWGARAGARLIGSMLKPSLQRFCREKRISIDHCFGHTYAPGEPKSAEKEMGYDFLAIKDFIQDVMR